MAVARLTYAHGQRVIEIDDHDEPVDTLYPNGECDEWRAAEPVLKDAGWRILRRPLPTGSQVFDVERVRG